MPRSRSRSRERRRHDSPGREARGGDRPSAGRRDVHIEESRRRSDRRDQQLVAERSRDSDRDRDREGNRHSERDRNRGADRERDRSHRDRDRDADRDSRSRHDRSHREPDPQSDEARLPDHRHSRSPGEERGGDSARVKARAWAAGPPPPPPSSRYDEPKSYGGDRDRNGGQSDRGHDRGAPSQFPRDRERDRGPRGGGGGGGRHQGSDRPPVGPGGKEQWGRPENQVPEEDDQPPVVVQPVMELSGKLAAETNKVNGTVLKYQPPVDAMKPDKRWRLYVFKGDKLAEEEPLYLHRNDCCLFGRDRSVVDVLCAHPSISKQHAVLQFRQTSKPDEFGAPQAAIRPYLMDLGTVNGTFLNGERIEGQRYYELLPKDVIKFGMSTRDYVLLHEELAKGG